MTERYDNIFEVKEGDKVKIDGSDTEYTVIKVNVQDGIILKDSNGEIERKRTPEKISKIDYTSSTQTSSTNNGTTSTTSTATTSPTSPVQLEKNSSVGFTRDPKSDDYVGDYVADNVTVEQETINKVINGENPNTVSQNEVKARTPDPNIPYTDTTDPTKLAKEAETAQVTGLNDLDAANIKKGGLFNCGKGTEKGVSDITGTDALYDISHNSDGSYDFKDVKTGTVYKVKQDANGNYVAYDQNNKPLNKGTSVSLNLQRVTKISDLSTNGNGLDNTPGSTTKGFVDIGNGEQEYSIISNGNGTYTFIDSSNNTYSVTYDSTTKKVTVINNSNNNQKVIDDKGISLRDEHFLWDGVMSGKTTYNNKSGGFQGGTTDISRVGDSVFGDKANNFYFKENAQDFSGHNSFDNFGAKEALTDYNTLEPIVNRTVADIHDYGKNTSFKSIEDAALALSRNGNFSYTEAKTLVNQAVAGGTTNSGTITTEDFTITPQTIDGKVEFYADPVNSFITEYDQKWKDYLADSKSDIEYVKNAMTSKVQSIRNECTKTLANINGWIDSWKGNGASATLNALECIKGKIENLYNNINDKFGAAIKALEDLDIDMKDLDTQEGYRVNYATEIQKLRTEMKTYNKSSDYTKEPIKIINTGNYNCYDSTGKKITLTEWNKLSGPDRGKKEPITASNPDYDKWAKDMQKHTELMEKLKALIEYYEPLQDKINEEINLVINFGTTIDSFDTFLKAGNASGGYLSSAQAIFNNHETIMRELTNFAKYPVITDKDIDFPDGMIVYMDDDPNHKYIVNGRGWDENGHYIIVEAIDPVTGKVIEGTSRRVYDVREVSKPTGWNDPVYKTTAPQDIPAGTTVPPSGTTAPPKGPVGPAGTTAPPKGPVGPSGTTAPPGTVAPVGTTAPPIIPTTKPSTIPPTTRPTVVPTVRPTVIPTVIPTIPSVIPDIDDPVGPAIPTLPPIPTPPTTPGPFIPHTGLENFATKETNESSLGLAGLAGLGLGALGLGAAAMSSDKEEDEEESKEEKEDKKQENVNKDFPNAWNHTVENNSEHIQ